MTKQEARALIREVWQDKATHGDDGEAIRILPRVKSDGPADVWVGCEECEEAINAGEESARWVREFVEDHLGCRLVGEIEPF